MQNTDKAVTDSRTVASVKATREVGISFRHWKLTSDRLIRIDPEDGSVWRFVKVKRTRNGSHVFTIEKVGDVRP